MYNHPSRPLVSHIVNISMVADTVSSFDNQTSGYNIHQTLI